MIHLGYVPLHSKSIWRGEENPVTNGTQKAAVWNIPTLVEWISDSINSGRLVEVDENDLYQEAIDKFDEEIRGVTKKSSTRGMTKRAFHAKIMELIWTKDRLVTLRRAIRDRLDLETLQQYDPIVPMHLILEQAEILSGSVSMKVSASRTQAGMSRLMNTEELNEIGDVDLPSGTLEDPVIISVDDPKNFGITIINAPLIGSQYSRLIDENPLRCALAEAERRGDKAVFLTGGLMHLDTRKAQGLLTTHRARYSGYEFNADAVDPSYKEEAGRIRKDLPVDELSYETLRERFLNLLSGFYKIALRPDDSPQFSGNVYIIFGPSEEELIESAAYNHVRYLTLRKQREVSGELFVAGRALKSAQIEDADPELIEELEGRVQALEGQKARTIITNVSPEDHKRFAKKLTSYLVQKYEEAIPGARVIGLGTTFVKMGDEVIEVHQASSQSATSTLLNNFVKNEATARTLSGTLPDVVLLCGPHTTNFSWAVVERAEDGTRKSSQVWQLPVTIDKPFVREQTRDIMRHSSPMERMLNSKMFEPGVVRLLHNNGMWNVDLYPIEALTSSDRRDARRSMPKYAYMFVDTDPHWGHPWKEYYYDEQNQTWLGAGVAVIEMMRRGGLFEGNKMPLHSFHLLDDGVQGHHFATESQPHQHAQSYLDLEREFNRLSQRALESEDPQEALQALEELKQQALLQLRVRGEHWTQTQLSEYITRMIHPNIDFFQAILRRVARSKLSFQGVSDRVGAPYDSRDFAPITFGNGNHFDHTVDANLTEGFFYASVLRAALMNTKFADQVEDLIKSPLYGNTHIGWGILASQDAYEYGISLRSNPTRKSGMGDPLIRMAANILERGDFPRIFKGKFALHLSGDIHRYGAIRLSDALIVSCASGTDTDPYGERGFSPNNTGNLVVGLPVDGPDSGPIRIVSFRHDFIEEYFREPHSIDWDVLLPNPA